MLIAPWIFLTVFGGLVLTCLIALTGWIYEGGRLAEQIEENKALLYENRKLAEKLAHRVALENIKVANEYYNKEN